MATSDQIITYMIQQAYHTRVVLFHYSSLPEFCFMLFSYISDTKPKNRGVYVMYSNLFIPMNHMIVSSGQFYGILVINILIRGAGSAKRQVCGNLQINKHTKTSEVVGVIQEFFKGGGRYFQTEKQIKTLRGGGERLNPPPPPLDPPHLSDVILSPRLFC